MSHNILFIKFIDGAPAGVVPEPALQLLSRHGIHVGRLDEGCNEITMPQDETGDTPIGKLSVHVTSGIITEISIGRPRYREPYRLLAFDLLFEIGFAMFSGGGEALYTRREEAAHLPQELREQAKFADLDASLPTQLA